MKKDQTVLELLRFVMGFIFLWGFIDKVFGLGFTTTPNKSWLSGTSPTIGFLKFGTHGPFSNLFQALAGNPITDWLFMMGLLGVGVALILGIGMKIASYSGSLMMFLIYLAAIPPEHNPVIDEHIVYILVLLLLREKAGFMWSLRKWWSETSIVKKYNVLE